MSYFGNLQVKENPVVEKNSGGGGNFIDVTSPQ